jgi:hypothetical protein
MKAARARRSGPPNELTNDDRVPPHVSYRASTLALWCVRIDTSIMQRSRQLLVAFLVACCAATYPGSVAAQTTMDARGSNSQYRFVDVSHAFKNNVVFDALYIGVPGSNEVFVGGGYQFKPAQWLTISPLFYGGIARENHERGVKVAVLALVDTGSWRSAAYIAQFAPVAGEAKRYFLCDSLDVTRVVKSWEVGVSLGIFAEDNANSWKLGPMIKHNDKRGAWALSARGGTDFELRINRVVVF